MNNTALYNIGYGLYVLTVQADGKDSGCITNTVMQITSGTSCLGAVSVNKQNYTHDLIMKSKQFNISVLTVDTPFDIFKRFGFQTGREVDKFADYKDTARSKNGILYLTTYTNAYLSFEVTDAIDFGTHTMFKSNIIGGEVLSSAESVTYAYYQQHIKPKPPSAQQKGGYRCNICGYTYEGDMLPDDFVCPLCKHGASDFAKII
ncbi:MAG: flavin reductase [Planctomycetaceae bacterium]|nr:flavin reductase [Planctomycetaceae bacterium]